jgi:hypothetical protein
MIATATMFRSAGRILLFLLPAVVFCYYSKAQKSINDSAVTFVFPGVNYGYLFPGGDMAKRFGSCSEVGGSWTIKLKSQWTISVDGQFLFGKTVREDHILDGISTEDDKIISSEGSYADVRFYERGYHFTLSAGRVFSFNKPNPNSGIWITAGGGFLQHKIKVDAVNGDVPQLTDEYCKGYDRLSNGFALREFLGYVYFGKKKLVNFYAGFEFIQAFTQNRRDYNFDTRSREDSKRTDLLNGFRIGWLLPLYKRPPEKYYLY